MALRRCISLTFTPRRALTYSCLVKIRKYVTGSPQIQRRLCHTVKSRFLSICSTKQLIHTTSYQGTSASSNSGVSDVSGPYSGISGQEEGNLEQKVTHTPVMVSEVIDLLQPKNGKLFIDMTFGAGGHTKAILRENSKARVVCLDRDPLAYSQAKDLAKDYSSQQVLACLGKFSELPDILCHHGISLGSVDGILFDVGASSMQFNNNVRGFSLSSDGPLDMRMDQGRDPDGVSALDVVNHLPAPALRDIIKAYGEDRMANKIAHTIVNARNVFGKITTTKDLANIIETAFDGYIQKDKLGRHSHVATRTFQALRIFVNNELNEINNGLEAAYHYLRPGGMCVGISFQSLEDRIFKRHFHGIDVDEAKNKTAKQQFRSVKDHHEKYSKVLIQRILKKKWVPVDKKARTPSDAEIAENPRSRSAKLRAALKSLEV